MKWKIAINSVPSPCHKCAKKVLPDDTQNGCRPTCPEWAKFRAAADADLAARHREVEQNDMEYTRIHNVMAERRRR